MKRPLNLAVILLVISLLSSCAVVRQGEVGVKRTLGKFNQSPLWKG
jgi:prohibitin 1